MDRRGFLGSILALAVAPAIVRASSLMSYRPIEMVTLEETIEYGGNQLLTISKITQEALKILEEQLTFSSSVDRTYDTSLMKIGNRVIVRKPIRFAAINPSIWTENA